MSKFFKNLLKKKNKKEQIEPLAQSDFTSTTTEIKEDVLEVKTVKYKNLHDLIVDDSNPNRQVLMRYLNEFGRTASEANNGETALINVKDNKEYSIIWMDLQMPKIDGVQCTKKLRESGYRGVIIGLTGHIDEESRILCKTAGMNDILAKPIYKAKLKSFIETYG